MSASRSRSRYSRDRQGADLANQFGGMVRFPFFISVDYIAHALPGRCNQRDSAWTGSAPSPVAAL
jgi:hypothetical protein